MSDSAVNVINPSGKLVSLPPDQVAEATNPQNGYRMPQPEEVAQHFKNEQFSTPGQQAATAVEGVGEGVLGPVFTGLERASGWTTPENIRARREANPGVHGLGQGLGLAGSSLAGFGEASLLEGAGKAAAEGLGLGAPVSALANIGASSAKAATEMALFQAGDETSKMLINDPNASFQTAIPHIGLAAAMGAGGGAALGAINPLWKATVGTKLQKFLEDFKGRVDEHLGSGTPEGASSPAAPEIAPAQSFDPFTKKWVDRSAAAEPVSAVPINDVDKVAEKLTPGAKAADYFLKMGYEKIAGKGLASLIGGAVGSVVGHKWLGAIIGERALGPFFESVLPSIIDPIMKGVADGDGLKSVVDYTAAINRGDKIISTAAKNIFRPQAEVLDSSYVPGEKDRKKLTKIMEQITENPQAVFDQERKYGQYLPSHATAHGSTIGAAYDYLDSIKPKSQKTSLLDKERKPSAHITAEYNKALDLAQQPALIFNKIKDGTITSRDLALIKSVYPSFYDRSVMKLHDELINHLSKEGTIPYPTRLGLAKYFSEPLDSTMQPQALMSIQQTMSQMSPTPQSDQATPRPPSAKANALSKSADSMQTQQQASEARHIAQF